MIYTIGYAGTDIERFVQILKNQKITLLIDVRSIPKSSYFYQFHNDFLNQILEKNNIKCENWKYQFSARQNNLEFYTNGILDYDKFAKSKQFLTGISMIKMFENKHYNTKKLATN